MLFRGDSRIRQSKHKKAPRCRILKDSRIETLPKYIYVERPLPWPLLIKTICNLQFILRNKIFVLLYPWVAPDINIFFIFLKDICALLYTPGSPLPAKKEMLEVRWKQQQQCPPAPSPGPSWRIYTTYIVACSPINYFKPKIYAFLLLWMYII